uniref:Ca3427-like PBP 2 domain-containing protein n=1 Tax=Vannella robusta TaxID=1487602 RepID=A0A7S4ISN7_9EUKA|mmetsp:Transcript_7912/g.9810  ORF Transcript_7912/g.9810 Transcript_7912/m.9810 type:complete len:302 (+) Transcript_7912:30-935(+)
MEVQQYNRLEYMTEQKHITIGGVPEHFNLPWYFALRDKSFQEHGIKCTWKDFPTGTGAMCQALKNKEVDFAVLLTEGIVKDLVMNANHSKIIQLFVESPLIWGVHVAKESTFETVDDLQTARVGISRFGSGSHLMAFVHAEQQGWNVDSLKFKEIGGLQNALTALSSEADYYLWEKFTTKPHVDDGTFRRIGEIPTPWPCFVIVARNEVLQDNPQLVRDVLQVINNITKDFKSVPNIEQQIAARHNQKVEDVHSWLSITEWSQRNISEEELDKVQSELLKLNLITKKLKFSEVTHDISETK